MKKEWRKWQLEVPEPGGETPDAGAINSAWVENKKLSSVANIYALVTFAGSLKAYPLKKRNL